MTSLLFTVEMIRRNRRLSFFERLRVMPEDSMMISGIRNPGIGSAQLDKVRLSESQDLATTEKDQIGENRTFTKP